MYTHTRWGAGGSAPGRVSHFKAPVIKPPNLTTWQGICSGLLCIFSSLASPGVHTSDSCTRGPAPAASLPGSRAWSRGPVPRSLLALTLDFTGREPLQASDRSPSLLVPVQLVCWEGTSRHQEVPVPVVTTGRQSPSGVNTRPPAKPPIHRCQYHLHMTSTEATFRAWWPPRP